MGGVLRPALLCGLLLISAYLVVLAAKYYLGDGAIRRHHLESIWMAVVVICFLLPWSRGTSGDTRVQDSSKPYLRVPLTVLVCTATAALLYWPTVSLGLFSDDFTLAEWARAGDFATRQWDHFRPFPLWIWSTVFAIAGNGPLWLHVLSIVLHAANGAMVVLLAHRMGLADPNRYCQASSSSRFL